MFSLFWGAKRLDLEGLSVQEVISEGELVHSAKGPGGSVGREMGNLGILFVRDVAGEGKGTRQCIGDRVGEGVVFKGGEREEGCGCLQCER